MALPPGDTVQPSPSTPGPSWGGRQGSRGLPGWSAVGWAVGCVRQTDQKSIRARGNPEFLTLKLLSRSCRAGGGPLGTRSTPGVLARGSGFGAHGAGKWLQRCQRHGHGSEYESGAWGCVGDLGEALRQMTSPLPSNQLLTIPSVRMYVDMGVFALQWRLWGCWGPPSSRKGGATGGCSSGLLWA